MRGADVIIASAVSPFLTHHACCRVVVVVCFFFFLVTLSKHQTYKSYESAAENVHPAAWTSCLRAACNEGTLSCLE